MGTVNVLTSSIDQQIRKYTSLDIQF